MRNKLLIVVCLSVFSTLSNAQSQYSYISDRKFRSITDLIGFTFCPNEMEIKDVSKNHVQAGRYSFGITQNNLYVDGEGIKGVYSVNNMTPTKFGYQLHLMNANNPTLQGHLKIFLNDRKEVDALMFKRSQKDKEAIFYQAEMPADLLEREDKFFTDRNELEIKQIDSLWGKIIRPFLIVDENHVQERFRISDNVNFEFSEKVTIIDKSKKKSDKTDANATTAPVVEKLDSATLLDKKKVKIIKEYFVKIHFVNKNPDGTLAADKSLDYKLDDFSMKEDFKSGNSDDRYQIMLKPKGDKPFYIYLNSKKMVSFIMIDSRRFHLRGI
ncbi:MAG: hypothetical protein RIS64_1434 [Bacteroidota bacterium]|jgi:hypothetical protein